MMFVNKNIEILSKYERAQTKVLCRCKIDGHEWSALPCNLTAGHGCPCCSARTSSTRLAKSHGMFVSELSAINPNIQVLSQYIHQDEKVLCFCKIDGHQWNARPKDLLQGKGCPECKKTKMIERNKKAHDVFVSEIAEISPNIEIIGEYLGSNKKILCRCRIDGHQWTPFASNLSKGQKCPECARRSTSIRFSKTHDDFITEMSNVHSEIEVLGQYVKSNIGIHCRCKRCNHEWDPRPADLLNGKDCPRCNLSHGEKKIEKILQEMKIDYLMQYKFADCINQRHLPFDFYIPSLKICIEYDGEQHYRPVTFGGSTDKTADQRFSQTQYNDEIKTTYCQKNKIKLIRIPYWEYENIEIILRDSISI